jgi:methyl-accepting chemotaxis protein
MMNLKQIKLRSLLLFSILGVTFIGFLLAVGIVSFKARDIALRNAYEIAEEMGARHGREVGAYLNEALKTAQELSLTLESMVEYKETDRETVSLILRKTLENNSSYFGVWTGWEPDAFDDNDDKFQNTRGHDETGRFIPYWFRSGNGINIAPLEGYDQPGTGDYYLLARNSGNPVLMDPFVYEVEGKEVLMTTVAVPVIRDENVLGVVGIDISLDSITNVIDSIRPFETGFATLVSNNGTIVGDGLDSQYDNDRLGKSLSEFRGREILNAISKGVLFRESGISERMNEKLLRIYYPVKFGEGIKPWSLNINIPESKIQEDARSILLWGASIGIIALIIIGFVIFWISNSIGNAIGVAAEKMEQVARGDLTQKIHEDFRIIEITTLKNSVNKMVEDMSGSVIEIRDVSGELSSKAEELSAASEESNAAIEEVISLTGKTNAATQEVASSVEETNASAEEVSNGAQSAAKSASEAGENTAQITNAAVEGEKELEEMVGLIKEVSDAANTVGETINELASSVSDISYFIEIITQIADQTNLLALNAAIEAARAGEAGQGFAVVAEEVRKLAEQVNGAASKVGNIITNISDNTENALKNQNETGEHVEKLVQKAVVTRQSIQDVVNNITTISESIQTIAATMEEQSASTEEMTAALENISNASQESAKNVENINSSMDEQGRVTETLAKGAEELVLLSRRMEESVAKFNVD